MINSIFLSRNAQFYKIKENKRITNGFLGGYEDSTLNLLILPRLYSLHHTFTFKK